MEKRVFIKKNHDFLQIRCLVFFCNGKVLNILMVQHFNLCFDLRKHRFFPFVYGLSPYKSIFVGAGSHLCSGKKEGYCSNRLVIYFCNSPFLL